MADEQKYDQNSITVLDGLEAVRRRPGMYIGDTRDGSGLHHMLWEVVANSLDEHLAGQASKIRVSVEGGLAEVEDDGRGIPIELMPEREERVLEMVLTRLHCGATWDGHLPHVHVSPQRFGVGLAVVNALSEELEVEVRRGGYVWAQRYSRGKPLTPLERGPRTERTGTRIRFRPDTKIFERSAFNRGEIRERLAELAIWNPALSFDFMAEILREPLGTVRWVERLANEHAAPEPLLMFATKATRDNVFVEAALGWSDDSEHELRSFVGQSQSKQGGSHVKGFWDGLAHALTGLPQPAPELGRPHPLCFRKRLSPGLFGVVHVALNQPEFDSPTRSLLKSPEAYAAVRDQIAEAFSAHLSAHPELRSMLLARIAQRPRK